MTSWLLHGSMVLVFAWLVVGGLGVPLPEDAALLATGVLIHQGASPVVSLGVAFVAVLTGDTILFQLARRYGAAAYERPLFRRLLPPARRLRIEEAYRKYGGWFVFFARHVVGIRAATFALAAIHGMRLRRFLLWDGAAAVLSVPLVVGVGYLGALHVERVRAGVASVQHVVVLAVILAVIVYGTVRWVRQRRVERRGGALVGDAVP
ncbi:MAG: DedA family protein [Proteobacteria bacterium]|nr:DedA family protein [Pseudomonadota bacterium]